MARRIDEVPLDATRPRSKKGPAMVTNARTGQISGGTVRAREAAYLTRVRELMDEVESLRIRLLNAQRDALQALMERNEQARTNTGMVPPSTVLIMARNLWSEDNHPQYNAGLVELAQEILADPLTASRRMARLLSEMIINPGLRASVVNPQDGGLVTEEESVDQKDQSS